MSQYCDPGLGCPQESLLVKPFAGPQPTWRGFTIKDYEIRLILKKKYIGWDAIISLVNQGIVFNKKSIQKNYLSTSLADVPAKK